MTRITHPDQELLDFSQEHLMYELNILRWLVETISRTPRSFQLSAYLESFTVHLRALTDFFYTEPKNARTDDVIATDFFDTPGAWVPGALPQKLEDATTRMNKEVGHITFKRKSGMDPVKPWPVDELFNEILPIARQFAKDASPKKLSQDVVAWAQADSARMLTLAGSASTQSSNTASNTLGGSWGAPLSSKRTP